MPPIPTRKCSSCQTFLDAECTFKTCNGCRERSRIYSQNRLRNASSLATTSQPQSFAEFMTEVEDFLTEVEDTTPVTRTVSESFVDLMAEVNEFLAEVPEDTTSPMETESAAESEQIKPAAYISELHRLTPSDLGRMNVPCPDCKALHWRGEKTTGSSWGSCCKKGAVKLPILNEPPQLLSDLLTGTHPESANFLNNIRQYNSAFAFTSFGTTGSNSNSIRSGFKPFKAHGELYHLQGPLSSTDDNTRPMYSQLYIYDPAFAANVRSEDQRNQELDADLIKELSVMLHVGCRNPFVQIYKHAHEILTSEANRQVRERNNEPFHIRLNPQMRMELIVGKDKRTQNLPTSNEIAAIIPNEYADNSFRDILITYRNPGSADNNGSLKRISETHAAYMPLHYVLLFPAGDYGWNWGMRLFESDKRLSQREFYRFRLHVRENESKIMFLSRRLFQQFLVDAWAVCEQNKLNWIRSKQDVIRADVYKGLSDATSDVSDLSQVGTQFILPSSFTGGPRFMSGLYQDAMALSRFFGKPTLFITFTANPQWKEITDELLFNQSVYDRPDLVARVFNLKCREFLTDLKKNNVFGTYKAIVRTIEYQKRGLPHVHILLFLDNINHRFDTPEKVDCIISAEIPDKDTEPDLYEVITKSMMHGPCGAVNPDSPCMIENAFGIKTCCKDFPKPYQPFTIAKDDGYPLYRRKQDGRCYQIGHPVKKNEPYLMTNEWVVPYNPFLCKKYKAHINVEVCATVKAIKYINKYIYKGSDQTTLHLRNEKDEIEKYLSGRYIGPVEATWRLFEYPMHEESPPVTKLAIHLPEQQPVYFDPTSSPQQIQKLLDNSDSTLMGYFKWNRIHQHDQSFVPYLYQQFPEHFVWNKSKKCWTPRKTKKFSVGRMYYCSPSSGERFYMRLLLTVVKAATSFEHLRTVNGVVCTSFREACMLLHLIEDDQEWIKCFEEAATFSSGSALRAMFISALLFDCLTSPLEIWIMFCESFCDDLNRTIARLGFSVLLDLNESAAFYNNSRALDYGLYLLEKSLLNQDKSLRLYNLPSPLFDWVSLISRIAHMQGNHLILNEMSYIREQETRDYERRYNQMNESQRHVFDTITSAVNNVRNCDSHFFLQGPAGTGKTFVYNTLCNYYRGLGKIVLCVASSGIAALLLPGGRTSHSRFCIPLQVDRTSKCYIKKNGDLADLIRKTTLIIWDEVPMQLRHCFEAVDRTFRDLLDNDVTFGGVPVVLGGDFAQIPPVVLNGGRPETVETSLIMSSILWPKLKKLFLTENMRLSNSNQEDKEYAEWIGNMSYNSNFYGSISLPSYVKKSNDLDSFVENVYPRSVLQNPLENGMFFKERAILCSTNKTVEEINSKVLDMVTGEKTTLFSSDTIQSDVTGSSMDNVPEEYLHSLTTSGLPPSKLELKVGLPVMLLRNLNPERGLCNGTRCIIHKVGQYVLSVKVLGSTSDQLELIPRFTLSTLPDQLPFVLTRKQFPLKVSFAMTINKSQGQSLKVVAVDLREPVFTHGQLYVALSRATSVNGVSVLFSSTNKDQKTENVVYPELLIQNH